MKRKQRKQGGGMKEKKGNKKEEENKSNRNKNKIKMAYVGSVLIENTISLSCQLPPPTHNLLLSNTWL